MDIIIMIMIIIIIMIVMIMIYNIIHVCDFANLWEHH